jgi:HEPN domain-containing protein
MRYDEVNLDARTPGPDLPEALSELVERLIADDWSRFSTRDASSFYYVVGAKAHIESLSGKAKFDVVEFPRATEPSPIGEWYVRSQTVEKHPNYLQKARRRLEALGGPPEAVDDFLKRWSSQGDFSFTGWRWIPSVPKQERSDALLQLMEAAMIPRYVNSGAEMDHDDLREAELARQKLYLREIALKYLRLVDRGGALDPAIFEDKQLEEASKCFLYGFYRATIVLSAAAVEKHLKEATGKDWINKYSQLVDFAYLAGKLGKKPDDLAEPAKDLFKRRNEVVHDGWNPTEDDAGELLGIAKTIVDHIRREKQQRL